MGRVAILASTPSLSTRVRMVGESRTGRSFNFCQWHGAQGQVVHFVLPNSSLGGSLAPVHYLDSASSVSLASKTTPSLTSSLTSLTSPTSSPSSLVETPSLARSLPPSSPSTSFGSSTCNTITSLVRFHPRSPFWTDSTPSC